MKRKACIIGSGIAGMAVALRLNHMGYQTYVFESEPSPGGKIKQIRQKGFRFDTGPSLFTLPALIEDLFRLYKTNPHDFIDYSKLKNITRYFYEDGTVINAWQDPKKFASEVEKQTSEPSVNIISYLKHAANIYNFTANTFIFEPFKFNRLFTKSFLRAGLNFRKLYAFKSMHQVNELFFSDPRVIQLFNRYATYNGSNPYMVPGTLSVISHLEHNIGAFFPKQGIYQIVQSLYDFSKQKGIAYSFNDKVLEIITKDNKIKGIKTKSGTHDFDLIVCNADVFHTYKDLLKDYTIPKKQIRQQRSSSALIFYWGISGIHEQLDLHNILFSENYAKEFEHIFQRKNIYCDPTVYIFISSKFVQDDAPKGKENWFVMINVPANEEQDWNKLIMEAKINIIKKINRILGIDIQSKIVFEDILDPRSIESRTGSYQGALYGNSSNSRFSAFLRQPNKSSIKGLYFVGGSVHPGGGIPLCLASASIAARIIEKYEK